MNDDLRAKLQAAVAEQTISEEPVGTPVEEVSSDEAAVPQDVPPPSPPPAEPAYTNPRNKAIILPDGTKMKAINGFYCPTNEVELTVCADMASRGVLVPVHN